MKTEAEFGAGRILMELLESVWPGDTLDLDSWPLELEKIDFVVLSCLACGAL